MVRPEVIQYVQNTLKQGFSEDQIRVKLLQSNYPAETIEEALKAAVPAAPAPQRPRRSRIKRRSIALVILFTIITMGLYGIYWFASTSKEMRKATNNGPSAWLLLLIFIPVINLLYLWIYCKSLKKLTGKSTIVVFILLIFFAPAGMAIAQSMLNQNA